MALLTRQMEFVSLMHYPFGYNDLNRKFLKDLTNYTDVPLVSMVIRRLPVKVNTSITVDRIIALCQLVAAS